MKAHERQMLKELHRRKREGHQYVPIRVFRSKPPKNWDHVRVFPGVYGRCIGEMDLKHWYLIDVPLEPLLAHVKRASEAPSNTQEGK